MDLKKSIQNCKFSIKGTKGERGVHRGGHVRVPSKYEIEAVLLVLKALLLFSINFPFLLSCMHSNTLHRCTPGSLLIP